MIITREQIQQYNPNIPIDDERWVSLFGYEGVLEVSNYGNIRSIEHTIEYFRGTTLVHRLCKSTVYAVHYSVDGYPKCMLFDRHEVFCHRAVALSFLEVPPNYSELEVDHIDYNPKNSYYKNLQWLSPKKNKERSLKNVVLTNGKRVRELNTGKNYDSIEQFCRETGFSSHLVDFAIYNCGGYIAKYDVGLMYLPNNCTFPEYPTEQDAELLMNMRIDCIRKLPYKGVRCITTNQIFPNAFNASIVLGLPKACVSDVLTNNLGYYKKKNLSFEYVDWKTATVDEIKAVIPHYLEQFKHRSGGVAKC